MEGWLQLQKKNFELEETHLHTGDSKPSRLNKKQKIAYKIIKKWVKKAMTDDNPEQILMQIQGMYVVAAFLRFFATALCHQLWFLFFFPGRAGVGKSFFLGCLERYVCWAQLSVHCNVALLFLLLGISSRRR